MDENNLWNWKGKWNVNSQNQTTVLPNYTCAYPKALHLYIARKGERLCALHCHLINNRDFNYNISYTSLFKSTSRHGNQVGGVCSFLYVQPHWAQIGTSTERPEVSISDLYDPFKITNLGRDKDRQNSFKTWDVWEKKRSERGKERGEREREDKVTYLLQALW